MSRVSMHKALTEEIKALIYREACVTSEQLKRIYGSDVWRKKIKFILFVLRRKGVIVSPIRGVYCRPDTADLSKAVEALRKALEEP